MCVLGVLTEGDCRECARDSEPPDGEFTRVMSLSILVFSRGERSCSLDKWKFKKQKPTPALAVCRVDTSASTYTILRGANLETHIFALVLTDGPQDERSPGPLSCSSGRVKFSHSFGL